MNSITNIEFSPSAWTIQILPAELLDLIMFWGAKMEPTEKNHFLQRRLLCKAFDKAIRPLVLKGLHMETTMFMRSAKDLDVHGLTPLGGICEAMYLDLMVVRDEEEASSLINIFRGSHPLLPEMEPLSAMFKEYSMGQHTFDENDFRSKLMAVIINTPNLKRFRINLPVQVVGPSNLTSTLLLATTFSVLANNRSEDHKTLETLVIDHLSATTINRICHNHMDLTNCMKVFTSLKHLVISLKRNEITYNTNTLAPNLWFLLRGATHLENLYMIGWNSRRDAVRTVPQEMDTLGRWQSKGLRYHLDGPPAFKNLKFLELKRISITGPDLLGIITEASSSLKELHLNEVCLKINSKVTGISTPLWIGISRTSSDEKTCWIAYSLRHMTGLKLKILRASKLGYDDFDPDDDLNFSPNYDLEDPAPIFRSFDQRFVDAVMLPHHPTSRLDTCYSEGLPADLLSPTTLPWFCQVMPEAAYDVEAYQYLFNNDTSQYKQSIDGLFFNHNTKALLQLGEFVSMADRVMGLMSDWVESARRTAIDERTGTLSIPALPGIGNALGLANLPPNAADAGTNT